MGIIKDNMKKVISAAVILTLAICGFAVYFLNEDKSERVATNMKSEEADQITEETDTENSIKNNEEEKAAEENEQAKVDEVSNVKVEEKKEQPKENVQQSEKPKETPKANENAKTQQTQQTQKEPSKPAVQSQKPANKVTTYTSKGLGISFDFPGNWNGKYVIKDNGDELFVYMKHSRNNEGLGLLFIITSHVEDAQFLDTIYGINKEQTLIGKKLVVGGPTDYRMIENDPLEKQYREMSSQCQEVLRTLR